MYLLDVHNAHEMGENLEKHGSSPQLPFNRTCILFDMVRTLLIFYDKLLSMPCRVLIISAAQ
jgi:hypothetical protein